MAYFYSGSGAAGNGFLTNLVAYWALDEASGASATDSSTNGKTLTLTGTSASGTGKVSGSRNMASQYASYFSRASDTDLLPGSGTFSVAMWLKPTSLLMNWYPSILGPWNTTGNQRGWTIGFNDVTNKLQFDVSPDGSTTTSVVASTALSAGTWSFIVATIDGTNINISFNGGAFQSTAFASAVHASTAAFRLFTVATNTSSAFVGDFDEVAIWKGKALTADQASDLYNAGSGRAYSYFS